MTVSRIIRATAAAASSWLIPLISTPPTVVPERADVVLGSCALVGDNVLVTASRAAVDTVERFKG